MMYVWRFLGITAVVKSYSFPSHITAAAAVQKSFRDFRFVSQFHLTEHMINVQLLREKRKTPLNLVLQTF